MRNRTINDEGKSVILSGTCDCCGKELPVWGGEFYLFLETESKLTYDFCPEHAREIVRFVKSRIEVEKLK